VSRWGCTLALLAFAGVSACLEQGRGAQIPEAQGGPGTGVTASDFSARDMDGNTFRLSSHLGKDVILLNFWQTWCEPCIAEFPHMRKLYETHKSRGLVVFGVAMDGPETVANVAAFAKRNQLNFPVLLDEDSHVSAIYNPKRSAPLSVIIDRSGKIAVIREGYNPGDEEFLAKDVEKLLSGAAP
jgi:peroxiredoxin